MDPEWNLEGHLLKLVTTMKFVRLKQLFEVYLINNFQEDQKDLLRYPLT